MVSGPLTQESPTGLVADYEALRAVVLSRSSEGPRLGRALFERAGMAAWIEACLSSTLGPRRADAGSITAEVQPGDGSVEAVRVLAGMALAVIGANR